jgi:hypothetical protein
LTAVTLALVLSLVAATAARSFPKGWRAPAWWLRQALCIHHYEGSWTADTGNGYFGGMQFLPSTYRSVGGRADGRADLDPPREQLYRAWRVYLRDGHSWAEWGTRQLCHLR